MAPTCQPRRDAALQPTLDELARAILDAFDEGGGALLGLLEEPDGGPGLALRPVGRAGPIADLLGWRAPANWSAVGLVGPATAHRDGARHDAVVALLVGRDGDVGCALRHDGQATFSPTGEGEGRLLDVCRRVLDLPTPPPRHDVGTMWARWWLDRVVEALAAAGGTPPTVKALIGLHPLAGALTPSTPDLADLARHPLAHTTWAELRALAVEGSATGLAPDVDEALAAWMDDGMFSRWCTDELLPTSDLLAAVDELAPPATARQVRRIVRAWERETPGSR